MPQAASSSQQSTSNPALGQQPPARIGLEELIEAASNGVLRAMDARLRAMDARSPGEASLLRPFPGPIVFGIIYMPDGSGTPVARQLGSLTAPENTGS